MALSPGIPTSFVPKQPVQPTQRAMRSGRNMFLIVALLFAGIVAALAIGVFVYSTLLSHQLVSKQAELAESQKNVDESKVEEFVRLRNRLTIGKQLLTDHILSSQFFTVLESATLQNVQYKSLDLTIAGDHSALLKITGTAKSFNALAAQSKAFAQDRRIKRAIFSNISVDEKKAITFTINADIDSALLLAGTGSQTATVQPLSIDTQTIPATTTSTGVSATTTAPARITP